MPRPRSRTVFVADSSRSKKRPPPISAPGTPGSFSSVPSPRDRTPVRTLISARPRATRETLDDDAWRSWYTPAVEEEQADPLLWAVAEGMPQMVEKLLANGAKMTTKTGHGKLCVRTHWFPLRGSTD